MSRTWRGKKPESGLPPRMVVPGGIKKPAPKGDKISNIFKTGQLIVQPQSKGGYQPYQPFKTAGIYKRPSDGTFYGSFETRADFWSRFEAEFGGTSAFLTKTLEDDLATFGDSVIPSESNLLSGHSHSFTEHADISAMLRTAKQNYELDPVRHIFRISKDQRYADQFVLAEQQYRKDGHARFKTSKGPPGLSAGPSGLAAGFVLPPARVIPTSPAIAPAAPALQALLAPQSPTAFNAALAAYLDDSSDDE
jgi:hypothetical protein